MPKIRTDLVGVVFAAGRNFAAGEDVPGDVTIDASLLDTSAPAKAVSGGGKGDQPPANPAPDAEKPAESDEKSDEDFSDLLGGGDAEKAAPKRSGRRTSTRKS